jgi:serine/tyrosine/threonine adenylyltransferase
MTAQIEAVDFFAFDNSYARLPGRFLARLPPSPVTAPRLVRLNKKLAWHLRLDPEKLAAPEGVEILAGNRVPKRGEPLAMAYTGHRFGTFVPQLGDGRAILLAEVIDRDGVRRDIQLKGSGPTPFSRRGDGRAALGPVLREYIVSEAMAALGIPTTRALAAVTTGEPVWRETSLPGAVLTRIASSHIRVGTFQFFAAREDVDAIRRLADHVIAALPRGGWRREPVPHPPRPGDLAPGSADSEVAARRLHSWRHEHPTTRRSRARPLTTVPAPSWTSITQSVYSSIDGMGRYAYGNQPRMAQWNLARLAETLLPLLAEDKDAAVKEAQEAIDAFTSGYETAYAAGLSRKLGLFRPRPDDLSLAQDLLERMARNGADFTLLFRRLCDAAASPDGDAGVRSLFTDPSSFDDWAMRWRHRLTEEGGEANERRAAMRAANPAFIPRNHLVEEAISAAVNVGDFQPFESLLTVLSMPYEDQPAFGRYVDPPRSDQVVYQTFCGT